MASKRVAVIGITGTFIVASAGSALAYVMKSGSFSLATTGVKCSSGYYEFLRNESNDFYYQCYLQDTAADGNAVFVHGKVAGYGYGTRLYHSSGSGTGAWKAQYLNDPAATWVGTARVEACQDRGTFISDLCDDSGFTNP